MRFYDCFIARNNFAFNLLLLGHSGDWVKYVEHVLSVEPVYILVKGDRGRGRS